MFSRKLDESDKKELEREMFGEGEEPVSWNQFIAIKCIVDERDELLAALRPFACKSPSPSPEDWQRARQTIHDACDAQSYRDLGRSGGIVDAP